MTQTTLSAATSASPDPRGVRWHRHSCLCAFAAPSVDWMADTAASLAAEILIANLELEFQLTYRKLDLLRISNRKYSRVLRRNGELYFRPFPYRLPTPGLEVRRSTRASLSVPSHAPLITHHSPLSTCLPRGASVPTKGHALLIYGSAIKTPRNPLKTRILTFSNRR